MSPIEKVINQLKRRDPQAIFVFGSYAWGTPSQHSDLDLLVVESKKQKHAERMKQLYSILPNDIAIDLIALDKDQLQQSLKTNSFYRQIINKGKLVYGSL